MLIAQITDIHAAPDNDNLSRFDRALQWLDHIAPDALVITGDLMDNHWYAGYQAIAERLSSHPWPSFILPGNADHRASMRAIWGDKMWAGDSAADALNVVADIGDIRLIGLDTTIEGSAAGNVEQHLAWLDKHLTAQTTTSLLFLHHHVFQSGIPTMDNIMCGGHQRLAEYLQHHPFPPAAIGMGHVHRAVMSHIAGIPAYICGSICPANPLWLGTETVPAVFDPPALMLYRFHHGVLTSHHIAV